MEEEWIKSGEEYLCKLDGKTVWEHDLPRWIIKVGMDAYRALRKENEELKREIANLKETCDEYQEEKEKLEDRVKQQEDEYKYYQKKFLEVSRQYEKARLQIERLEKERADLKSQVTMLQGDVHTWRNEYAKACERGLMEEEYGIEKTLRDEFAMAVVPFCLETIHKGRAAKVAYEIADDMMKARNKETQ